MPNITGFNIQGDWSRNFITKKIYYIKSEKTDKIFANEYIVLKDYKFIGSLAIIYPVLRRMDSLIRFLWRVGTCKTLWRVGTYSEVNFISMHPLPITLRWSYLLDLRSLCCS